MTTINECTVIGYINNVPELRSTKSGMSVLNLWIETSSPRKLKSGQVVDEFEQHPVVLFGKLAERIASACEQDDLLYVKGPIRTRKRCAQSGEVYHLHEINATDAQLMSKWINEMDGERERHNDTQEALGL